MTVPVQFDDSASTVRVTNLTPPGSDATTRPYTAEDASASSSTRTKTCSRPNSAARGSPTGRRDPTHRRPRSLTRSGLGCPWTPAPATRTSPRARRLPGWRSRGGTSRARRGARFRTCTPTRRRSKPSPSTGESWRGVSPTTRPWLATSSSTSRGRATCCPTRGGGLYTSC
jgi:hypothetical protein